MAPGTGVERALSTLRSERGFTLVELLVATSMMLVLTTGIVALFISTIKDQSRITKNSDQVGETRVALRTMVDDIRQGSAPTATPTASELKLKTYIHAATCTSVASPSATGIQCGVTYKCAKETSKTTYECTRAVEGGIAKKIVGGLANGSVFIYPSGATTSATYIGVVLTVPTLTGTNTTTFEDGAALRDSTTNLGY